MRNLKKTLCMVLALVLVLGLCTVGVGAVNGTDFDDQETINYSTAVKAMSGLGVLKGDDNDGDGKTEFRPQDPVTRAEAAKIIAYVNVGEEVEKWPARQVFDDVPADHWAAKYITYCQYNNIIAGYGNGKFGPNDPVTQAQLAKMLLSCCGYGAKDEFIGEGWDQNVAKVAFQTKVLKGILSTDWDGPATREETALLAYNTMMNVFQVVLSKDTNSYVNATINGVQGVTLSQSTWDLTPIKGVVMQNKANLTTAKGTTIRYSYTTAAGALAFGTVMLETEEDGNADILGHEVTVMYREEGVAPNNKLVAYYIDDECTEVSGAEANTADYADVTAQVDNGNATVGIVLAAPGGAGLDPGKNNRYRDYANTYVLNGEGKLVSIKTSSFYVAPVTINSITGIATVGAGVEIIAPEGAKTGDLLTVYTCGNVRTGKFCTTQEKVAISQSQLVDYTAYAMGSWYTYNDGAIKPSDATNVGAITLTSVNASNITLTDDNTLVAGADLMVGWTYTLVFDAEGGLIGFTDGVETAEAAATSYYLYVGCYGPVQDAYGVNQYYAQVVKGDGTVQNLVLDAADVIGAPGAATGVNDHSATPVALAKGDVITVRPQTVGGVATGKSLLYKGGISAPNSAGLVSGVVAGDTYQPTNPQYDFSSAKFIYYTGALSTLTAKVTDTTKPKLAALDPASKISYSFKQIKVGTVIVSKIETVWFDVPADVDANVANSYVYVINGDTKETKLVNNVAIPFFNGYKDGVKMDDLRVASNTAPDVGFYKYEITASTGNYKLSPIAAGNGTATGSREIYLVNNDANFFILNNTLYVRDGNGSLQSIDISSVKFVRINQTGDYDALKPFTLDSAAAIQNLLLLKDHVYRVKLNFVEIVTPTAVPGVSVHSIGSGVIYITSVS